MRKFLIIMAGAMALLLALGSALAASAGTSVTASQTIRLVARQVAATLVPVPGQTGHQLVPGDQLVFTDSLTRNGASYGHDAIHCVIVVAADAVCVGAFTLPGGQLTIAGDVGSINSHGSKTVAVTGGTGLYRSTRGQLTVKNRSATVSVDTFQLIP
jgi:hypothetical protein